MGADRPPQEVETVPPDFSLTYESGATHAEWGRTRMSLDAAGRMVIEETRGMRLQQEKREGQVPPEALLAVVRSVHSSGFMRLKESYADRRIMDGWSAWIRVRMNGCEHSVTVLNTSVREFDQVASAMRELAEKTVPQNLDKKTTKPEEKKP
jgi:hypothetical protein